MDRILVVPYPASYWESLGYGQEHAVAMRQLNKTLIRATSKLNRLSEAAAERATNADIVVGIGDNAADALPGGSILPDDSLQPLWKQIALALVSLAANQCASINLDISNIQLSTQMLSVLEPALKVAPIKDFWLDNNRLGSDEINFVTSVLKENHSLSRLYLWNNEIDGRDALSLLEAARKHPRLQSLCLEECGIGRILQITPEIVPALLSLKIVHLEGNGLGSHGAHLISNCLATNPGIKGLNLGDNLFNDGDAMLFAHSLMTNTNLKKLSLSDNNFTEAGLKTLYKSVYDEQSPNTIYGSNHTCQLVLFDEGEQISAGIDEAVLLMNDKRFERNIFPELLRLQCERAANGNARGARRLLNVEGRKKVKMLHAIQGGNSGQTNMQWIENIPVELMPEVLVFLQESGKYVGTKQRGLDRLFQVIRARRGITSFHSVPDEERGIQRQCKKRRISGHQSN